MDDPIISRETIRRRGAAAFDQGLGQDDHNMNPGAAAIKDWQFGWHTRRIEKTQAERKPARQQLEAA